MRRRNTAIVSESYLIQQLEKNMCDKLRVICFYLGAHRAQQRDPYEKEDHFWRFNWSKDGRKRNEVRFKEYRYDPADSEIVYGQVSVIEDDKVEVDGFSRVLDNSGSSVDSVDMISEAISTETKNTHEFNQEYRFDVTSSTSVEGSYGGAKISTKLEATFGTTFQVNTSEEETTATVNTVSKQVTVPAGKKLHVAFERNKLITEQPFTVKGVLDFAMELNLENWTKSKWFNPKGRKGNYNLTFNNVQEFEQFLEGYNTDFPDMRSFLDECPQHVYNAVQWVLDESNRTVEAVGVKRREYSDNLNVVTKEV